MNTSPYVRVWLLEDGKRKLILDVLRADSLWEADQRVRARYKNLFRNLQTGRWSTEQEVVVGHEPTPRQRAPSDSTLDLI